MAYWPPDCSNRLSNHIRPLRRWANQGSRLRRAGPGASGTKLQRRIWWTGPAATTTASKTWPSVDISCLRANFIQKHVGIHAVIICAIPRGRMTAHDCAAHHIHAAVKVAPPRRRARSLRSFHDQQRIHAARNAPTLPGSAARSHQQQQ